MLKNLENKIRQFGFDPQLLEIAVSLMVLPLLALPFMPKEAEIGRLILGIFMLAGWLFFVASYFKKFKPQKK